MNRGIETIKSIETLKPRIKRFIRANYYPGYWICEDKDFHMSGFGKSPAEAYEVWVHKRALENYRKKTGERP